MTSAKPIRAAGPVDASVPAVSPASPATRPGAAHALPIPASAAGEFHPEQFLNRELSWLEFNRRVLHEALDERTPLLDRVSFLAIFNSNLDEFFQKRVGGLKKQIAAGVATRTPDGLSPREQLAAIRAMVAGMLKEQADCYTARILPALAQAGVHLLTWEQLTDEDRRVARQYFRANLFPMLTPLAVDPGHPFPFISNLSMSLGVLLRVPSHETSAAESAPGTAAPETSGRASIVTGSPAHAARAAAGFPARGNGGGSADHRAAGEAAGAGSGGASGGASGGGGDVQFARVKVPTLLPRWVRLNQGDGPMRFVHLAQIMKHNLQDLFEGMEILEVRPFRVTRNADVGRDDEDAEDLVELIEQELRDRRFGQVVRLEVDNDPDSRITSFLIGELELEEADVYHMEGELDYTDLRLIADLHLPQLKQEAWTPIIPPRLADHEADIFSIIRAGDVLVHHPYESFSASVERFIRDAANDPRVVAIKQTLYRTSSDSPFIPDLMRAAESGKQVVCLVELKARFDEERNIRMAQTLEKAGVHVVYGLVGLKTHTKTALVVRYEPDGMRCYAHIGTGNYNSKTAQLYTDLGLLTCNPLLTADLVEFFHYLTGRSVKRDFGHLLIAPTNMKKRFVEMLDREIAHAAAWRQRGADPADPNRPHIIAKMNSLEDRGITRKLYDASAAGVRVELVVRGFCCLRPGVPGLSENITVMSVIGRFLEHSRIFYFHNAGKPEYYIGSADWMYRNLNNRIECVVPILEPALQARLKQILDIMLSDRRQAWDMRPDGTYAQRRPDGSPAEAALGTHAALMHLAKHDAGRNGNE